jgi:heme/copper-type cytochrome/quinol oxidase subunit 2
MIAPYFAASLAVLAQRAQERAPRDANLIFPVEASTVARGLDDVFYFILWVSIISFVIVIGAATVFVLRYRAREGHQAEKTPSHDMRLELTWTVIPTILVAVMFFFGSAPLRGTRRPCTSKRRCGTGRSATRTARRVPSWSSRWDGP